MIGFERDPENYNLDLDCPKCGNKGQTYKDKLIGCIKGV